MTSRSVPTTQVYSYSISSSEASRTTIARLSQDWEECRWETADWLPLAPLLDDVLRSIRSNPDEVLRGLIVACQGGHPLAGRVIIQALLPKLILMSRSFPYPAVDHLLSALWIRVVRYPLVQRPTSIAANLVLDTRKDALAECRVRIITSPVPEEPSDEEVTAQYIISTARALQLATPESLSIIEKVYIEGLPSAQVAELYSMTPEAVRRRCSDTVKRLRAHREVFGAH